ncbi:hypothetical protein C1645_812335 [Glomus cerebriforme]|uniref:NrS-1 polymerase-like helicase domain-containing protein n=1 Tax=Glomus cerebriforme TaxID=658196 RepID=A0A397TQJ3_9GLOM|nr:hypothetical protein C1645_812335 [Glomus cerebriforme]
MKEHIHVKKAVHPKNGTIFNFIFRSPNDESKVINSPLLAILKAEMGRCPSINNITTDVEFKLAIWVQKAFKKLTISETALDQEQKLSSSVKLKDLENGLHFDMTPKLDLAKFGIIIIKHGGKSVKLKSLISQAVTKGFLAKPIDNAIQARKLIIMNEIGSSSEEWHKFNGHLKSLIMEGKVAIECKDLKTIRINDYAGYMVTSNQDALLKIDIENSCIIYYDILVCCKEKNIPSPNTSKDKKRYKKSDLIQELFNYVTAKAPVISTSGISKTSKTPELVIDSSDTSKHSESIEPICKVINTPPKETSVKHNLSKPNEVSSAILLSRDQCKNHLRKRAVKLEENPNVFVTITKKDKLNSIRF